MKVLIIFQLIALKIHSAGYVQGTKALSQVQNVSSALNTLMPGETVGSPTSAAIWNRSRLLWSQSRMTIGSFTQIRLPQNQADCPNSTKRSTLIVSTQCELRPLPTPVAEPSEWQWLNITMCLNSKSISATAAQRSQRDLIQLKIYGRHPLSQGSFLVISYLMRRGLFCRVHESESEKTYTCQYCHNRFKNKNKLERHQNSFHLRRHSWSCAALTSYEAAFHPSPFKTSPGGPDVCGYCGQEFGVPANWAVRIEHLNNVHKFGECNQAKKFFRADHFRQHLKHSHAGTSGKWTNMLENACMKDEHHQREWEVELVKKETVG